jgi:hypothetical protein
MTMHPAGQANKGIDTPEERTYAFCGYLTYFWMRERSAHVPLYRTAFLLPAIAKTRPVFLSISVFWDSGGLVR